MSSFKRSVVKGGSSKGKEPMIDVDDLFPTPKKTRSSTGMYEPTKFRSYTTLQTYEKYFWLTSLLVERVVDQPSLLDTTIPTWFATKNWNFLLSDLDDAYENMMKEFYANAIVEGEELKCWVKGKIFLVTPTYLAKILHINRPMFTSPPIYNDLNPDEELLRDALGRNLEFSPNGNSISVSSLSLEIRVLTIIMFHNLYSLSSTRYMNLGRALFLHDLISDEDIDIYSHIFHSLCKNVTRTESRICIPFCCLISRILKLKGIHPSEDESPHPKPSPINIHALNASIGHSRKGVKKETSTQTSGSRFSSSSYDEKLDSIMATVHDMSTKMSGLAFFLHHHNIHCDTKFTSFQTQLDEIQRKLEENDD